jgi:holin-like protein
MIGALGSLLGLQLIGEVLVLALGLPVPGPVLGLLILLVALRLRPAWLAQLRSTALGLLQHLSLLFVPAGVGVMVHAQRLSDEGLAIVMALLISTLLAIAATALTVQWLMSGKVQGEAEGEVRPEAPASTP